MTTWLLIIGLLFTAYFLYYYFKKHFSQNPLFRVFVSMVSYVLIALVIMMLLTWPSFY